MSSKPKSSDPSDRCAAFYGSAGFRPTSGEVELPAPACVDDPRPSASGTADGDDTVPTAPLAHVVHLSEGSVLLLRVGASTLGWRERFRNRLRTCGPWNETQVRDYFLLTYGGDPQRWPFALTTIARVFRDDAPDRGITVARDSPEVYAFLTSGTPWHKT